MFWWLIHVFTGFLNPGKHRPLFARRAHYERQSIKILVGRSEIHRKIPLWFWLNIFIEGATGNIHHESLTRSHYCSSEGFTTSFSRVVPKTFFSLQKAKQFPVLSKKPPTSSPRTTAKPVDPSCSQVSQSCFPLAGCCDPSAVCRCRFFNAICFCRKIKSTHHKTTWKLWAGCTRRMLEPRPELLA